MRHQQLKQLNHQIGVLFLNNAMFLNEIGMNDKIPKSMRFRWGCVLPSSSSAKQAVVDEGVVVVK